MPGTRDTSGYFMHKRYPAEPILRSGHILWGSGPSGFHAMFAPHIRTASVSNALSASEACISIGATASNTIVDHFARRLEFLFIPECSPLRIKTF